mgnify:CR=1 FL=1
MQIKFTNHLLHWYSNNKRALPFRKTNDPYKIWVSEVMLQQTQIKTVIPFYNRWVKEYPTLKSAANANLDKLLKIWEGLGYYGRCRNFHKALKIVEQKYKGEIPNELDEFLTLPGVGQYTAGAVLSIAYQKCIPAIDGNVIRVMARILGIKNLTAKNQRRLKSNVQKLIPITKPGNFNQGLMELGALVCTSIRPSCEICPLSNFCKAYKYKEPELYPLKKKKKVNPHYIVVAGIIWRDDKFFIQKRDQNAMLGGLWEFPGGKVENGESLKAALSREIKEECNIVPIIKKKVGFVKHSYSHFSISLHCFHCIENDESINQSNGRTWITMNEIDSFAFPKANHKIFSLINQTGFHV